MALDKDTFEYQVCLMMLTAAGADSTYTEQELAAIAESLNGLFFVLKKNENSMTYLQAAIEDITALSEEEVGNRIAFAITSLKANLPQDQLDMVFKNMKAVAEVDGLDQAEADFLSAVQSAWY